MLACRCVWLACSSVSGWPVAQCLVACSSVSGWPVAQCLVGL